MKGLPERWIAQADGGASNLAHLRAYRIGWLQGDLLAGVTVAAYLVPQVMAYAEVAGLPNIAGLWAMVPCLLIYTVLGSSRQLSVGPESTTALLTASIVGPIAAGHPDRYAGIAAELALVFGAFCVIAWLLRLGFVAELLSRPVLVGYIAGVATIMAFGQLGKITGVSLSGGSMRAQLNSLRHHLGDVRIAPVAVAAGTIVLLVFLHRVWPNGPGALIAVAVSTGVVDLWGLEQRGVAVVGPLRTGLPDPSLPPMTDLSALPLPALGLLVVGYTDNILTARSFADRGSRVFTSGSAGSAPMATPVSDNHHDSEQVDRLPMRLVIGLVNLSIVVNLGANVVSLLRDPPWLKALGDMLTTVVGLVALARIWQVFRFDFGNRSFEGTPVVRVCWVWGYGQCDWDRRCRCFVREKVWRHAKPRSG